MEKEILDKDILSPTVLKTEDCSPRSSYSLVKYANPHIVSRKDDKVQKSKKIPLKRTFPIPSKKEISGTTSKETEEVLDLMFPPVEWEEDNLLWRKSVSRNPASRTDVIKLGENLDILLKERQARDVGICPIRRELFDQLFDELIRQVTVTCTERGLLLLRTRDELRMTLTTYQKLYESSVAFGLRKLVLSEEGKTEREDTIEKLKEEKLELEEKLRALELEKQRMKFYFEEENRVKDHIHKREVEHLTRSKNQAMAQLEAIIQEKINVTF